MVVAMVTCALNGKANMGKKKGNMTAGLHPHGTT